MRQGCARFTRETTRRNVERAGYSIAEPRKDRPQRVRTWAGSELGPERYLGATISGIPLRGYRLGGDRSSTGTLDGKNGVSWDALDR